VDSDDREALIANAMYNRGVQLARMGQIESAIESYESLVRRFRESPSAQIQEDVAKARSNVGILLGREHREDEALRSFDESIASLERSEEPRLKSQWGIAAINRGFQLGRMRQADAAALSYSSVIERFSGDSDKTYGPLLSAAMLNRGTLAQEQEQFHHALNDFQSLFERFSESFDDGIRSYVDDGLFNMALCFEALDRGIEALAAYDTWLDRHCCTEIGREDGHAEILRNRAIDLLRLERFADSLVAFEDLFATFGDDDDEHVATVLTSAWPMYEALKQGLE